MIVRIDDMFGQMYSTSSSSSFASQEFILELDPEIDIFEVMPGQDMPGHTEYIKPFMSNSLQVSPGIPKGPLRPKMAYHSIHHSFGNGLTLCIKLSQKVCQTRKREEIHLCCICLLLS
jgi:hypothetical protein